MGNRILINGILFKIFPEEEKIVQVGNPDNVVVASDLQVLNGGTGINYYLRGYIDPVTGKVSKEHSEGYNEFTVGYDELVQGYDELSSFADELNSYLPSHYNVEFIGSAQMEKLDYSQFFNSTLQIPTIQMEERVFEIDPAYGEIRQSDRPTNFVPFGDLTVQNGKYKVYVYPETGNLTYARLHQSQAEYNLPQLVSIAPMAMAAKYGVDRSTLPETDRELQLSYYKKQANIVDHVPTKVSILGETYSVDLRRQLLFGIDDPKRSVNLLAAAFEDGEKFLLFYDIAKDAFINIDPDITEVPKGVVMVELPGELVLDPVTAGEIYKHGRQSVLRNHVSQPRIEARIHPLSSSYVPELVKQNREKQKEEKLLQPIRRRKGKGL